MIFHFKEAVIKFSKFWDPNKNICENWGFIFGKLRVKRSKFF